MPHKLWSHAACGHPDVQSGSRPCPECGQESTVAVWGYSMIEAMGAYQGFYGLKPVGPHRPLANSLLEKLVDTCAACNGNGVLGRESGDGWKTCKICHGFGRRLNSSESVFLVARKQVLKKFPGAVAPRRDRY